MRRFVACSDPCATWSRSPLVTAPFQSATLPLFGVICVFLDNVRPLHYIWYRNIEWTNPSKGSPGTKNKHKMLCGGRHLIKHFLLVPLPRTWVEPDCHFRVSRTQLDMSFLKLRDCLLRSPRSHSLQSLLQLRSVTTQYKQKI